MSADLEGLLPHRPPMVLVDGVESAGATECVSRCSVPAASPWVEDGRLLRAAFVEIAAQTAALHAGLANRAAGGPARRGYLALVSDLRIHGDARTGDVLRCSARRTETVGLLARVECRVERVAGGAAALLAGGTITVALDPDRRVG